MMLRDLGAAECAGRLRDGRLRLRTGPFVMQLQSPVAEVAAGVSLLYADYPVPEPAEFADFSLQVMRSGGLRRWIKPQARFFYDGQPVFEPMALDHAYPLLEWSMNWCVASQAHQYLLLHAAVIERNGLAVILPAPPGSGKSTLCAGLIHAGWRLVSDEMALVERDGSGRIWPLCRPVSLKNRSIDVMRAWAPQAVFNRVTVNTTKGNVTHMQAPAAHVARMHEPAVARWVVFPRWQQGSAPVLSPRSRAASVIELARNAFNYAQLGEQGFHRLVDLVRGCDCHDFRYASLDDAVKVFDRLAAEAA
ncbi:HprK-related kinase A [Aquabacterium sp. OR-4]|uniref:HprK-related kinase A n=1 Tax=Aquabacterium sp. OR-4 TaxID=2978127 RepID=UPI0021B4A535|nr:HprK-related kinase A [Aquabacterium sp. OR-4]MDT7836203.1 HprK-related kinase A [Aquabacterium sp. OR-4]